MKQGLLKRHFRLSVLVLTVLAAALPMHLFAETGTTIVFNASSSHGLYSSGASNTVKANQWFAFLRHDIAHVQIIASNWTTLSSNESGTFAKNANNVIFSNNLVKVTNWAEHYGGTYLAVVAPKGYRFTKYEWEIDGSTASEKMTGAYIEQYSYNGTSTNSVNKYSLQNLTAGETFTSTLSDGSNVLYFYLNTGQSDGSSATAKSFFFKSIKFTYVIDKPFDGPLPATDLSNNVHTGLLDLGTFSKNNKGANYNSFAEDRAATDTQEAKFYNEDGTINPTAVTVDDDQYYVTATNGTYYVEAPAKFRIVGATLNFLKSDASGTTTTTTYTYTKASSITSGNTYLISDGNGHYLNNNNGTIETGTDAATATLWTISGSSNSYTIKNGDKYLICETTTSGGYKSYSLKLSDNSSSWIWDSSKGFKILKGYSQVTTTYIYLAYDNNKWTISQGTTNSQLQTKTATSTSTSTTFTGGYFTATVYGTDGNTSVKTVSVSDDATSQSVALTDLNNDAVKFAISGLTGSNNALYNVTLKLMPLNPELQNLSVATKLNDGEATGASAYSPENYTFDNITVVVPSNEASKDHTLYFKEAYNENRAAWYTDGTLANSTKNTAGYSNYFLVNSAADNGGTTNVSLDFSKTGYPADRTTATQAGTVGLLATNIDKVYDGTATELKDNAFTKTEAKYDDATVTPDGDSKTYYIYTADVPTYTLLTSGTKHIDYRYYTLTVQCKSVKEKAVARVYGIYDSTLKSRNNKNTGILADGNKPETGGKAHTFYGVKVTSAAETEGQQALGYLTSAQVVAAVKEAVKTFSGADSLRRMLFLDMSSLTSVDNDAFDEDFNNSTADNCLYFMQPNFHRSDVTNCIAKDGETFKAVSDIKIYDQQPFFTPYDFTTDTHSAIYEREGTSNYQTVVKDKVTKMAVMLPFDVLLDGKGHMKSASDATDEAITYYKLTNTGEVDHMQAGSTTTGITFGFVKEAVTDGKAEANKPYYVETSDDTKGFSYKVLNAAFKATYNVSGNYEGDYADSTNVMNDKFTAVGTFSGRQIEKDNTKWYFSKDLFWKSGALTQSDIFNVRPFRAYFNLTGSTTEAKAVAVDANDLTPTGISDVTTGSSLEVSAHHGAITLKAQGDTRYAVYTVAGQLVANGQLAAGETQTVNVKQGVYLVNDKKTVVK